MTLVAVIAAAVAVIVFRSHGSGAPAEASIGSLAAASRTANTPGDISVSLVNQERELMQALDSAENDVARHQILVKYRDNQALAQTLLAEARSAATRPVAIRALAQIVSHFSHLPAGRAAADLMLNEYISDESLEYGLDELEKSASESDLAIELLRAAYRLSPHARVKGRAGFSLASLLKTRAERDGWRDLVTARAWSADAESLFEEVAALYGTERVSRGLLADLARSRLDELKTVSVGRIAPEIVGADTDGRPMRLSDYRGKVVVLAFWGNWCSLCRAMFPYERSLVERMRGRPFVLLGVNSDDRTPIAQTLAENKTVTWRSWRDGGEVHGGAIARRWNVQPLPDIFILDDRGMIRHHVGPRFDDHGPVYLLDAHGRLQHRWQARTEEVLDVALALVREAEREQAGLRSQ
jgi:peroxiredoxin